MFGFERSGTTLLSMMMGAHPELAVPLSLTGIQYEYGRRLARYSGIATTADLERLVDDLLAEERIKLWDAALDRTEVLAGLDPGSFAAVFARLHELYAKAKGKPRWGNIDIATLDDMDMAHDWFPEARFIHIVRDGRDVALSHMTIPYGASNIAECAQNWVARLHTNLKMGAILGPQRYKVVRYEDLVTRSEATLEELCAFVGLSYSPEMLRYTDMVTEKIPVGRRWLWPALDRPPDASRIGGWRTRMSSSQRIVFEWKANALLRQLGYEAYETVPKRPLAYVLELWYFLGQGHRFRRLAGRLGFKRASQLERQWSQKDANRARSGLSTGTDPGVR